MRYFISPRMPNADSEGSDQPAQMRRLIWAYTGACHNLMFCHALVSIETLPTLYYNSRHI